MNAKIKSWLKRKCRNLRVEKNDTNRSSAIFSDNKLLKNLEKRVKANYKLKIPEEMASTKTDQRVFWNLFHKIHSILEILRSNRTILVYPDDSFITEEMIKSFYILKTNKSAGYVTITNEIIVSFD